MSRGQPIKRVGRYAVYGAIASGGMASVHWGRLVGEAGFARVVAIKRLHPHIAADPDFTTMLRDEARIVARIRHPNVVPTLDMVSGEGELILVMEYVHGEALSRLNRTLRDEGGRVAPNLAAAIACAVLEGLHAAHEATDERGGPLGIVHRDVTPHNVLVGADGVARIADFGVARAAGRLQNSTQAGSLKGKIGYMSPEQIRSQTVDRRTDIYAAGVVLWEMLAGRRAFEAEDDIAAMARVLTDELQPPSTFVPGVPAGLDEVVRKALARDRGARFATAREMAVAIESVCTMASTREVSVWVERLAHDALAERAATLAAVEAYEMAVLESSGNHPAVSLLSSSAPRMVPPAEADPTQTVARRSSSEPISIVTRLTASAAPRTTTRPAVTRRPAVLLIALALFATLAVVAFARIGARDTDAPKNASAPDGSAPAIDSAPRPPPSAASTPSVVPSASASAGAGQKRGAAPQTTKPDCADPFRQGPDGILHVRPECVR